MRGRHQLQAPAITPTFVVDTNCVEVVLISREVEVPSVVSVVTSVVEVEVV